MPLKRCFADLFSYLTPVESTRMTHQDDSRIRRQFNRIDDATVAALREARPFILEKMPGILDGFYRNVGRFQQTSAFF